MPQTDLAARVDVRGALLSRFSYACTDDGERACREINKELAQAGVDRTHLKRAAFAKMRTGIGLARAMRFNSEVYDSNTVLVASMELKNMKVKLSQHR